VGDSTWWLLWLAVESLCMVGTTELTSCCANRLIRKHFSGFVGVPFFALCRLTNAAEFVEYFELKALMKQIRNKLASSGLQSPDHKAHHHVWKFHMYLKVNGN